MYDFELTKFLVECSTTEGEPSANNFPVDVRRVSGINLKNKIQPSRNVTSS